MSKEIRPAKRADADQVAGVHVRSWQVGYRGLLPDAYLQGMRPDDRAKRYTFEHPDPSQPATLVAVEHNAIVGFATIGPSADDDSGQTGELLALYVDPPRWGFGAGRALIAAARERLGEDGFREAVLWLLVGNQRAERFYRIDGWSPDGARRREDVWGVTVDEIRYRRSLT
ncbi:MAG: GNAT family N-acetyltransferase [Acidimicrobiales bacterium]